MSRKRQLESSSSSSNTKVKLETQPEIEQAFGGDPLDIDENRFDQKMNDGKQATPRVWLARGDYAKQQAMAGKRGYYMRADGTAFKRKTKRKYGKSRKGSRSMGPSGVYKKTGFITLRGRGDYAVGGASGLGQSVFRPGAFASVGSRLGGYFGKWGESLGSWAGSKLAGLVGFGDYKLNENSLVPLDMGTPVPSFDNISNAAIVTHREYIQDIIEPASNAGAFTLTNFNINVGLARTFPWLSQLADNFDQYRLLGCVFEFKSTSSPINNTAGGGLALGTVVLATDYDSVDNNYSSKLQMENSQYCMSGKPSCDILHPIECAPALSTLNVLYTRTGVVPSGKDQRMYDLGNFQIATVGIPNNTAAQTLGELWVTYQVALLKPQLNTGLVAGTIPQTHFIVPVTTISGGNYFGTSTLTTSVNAEAGSNIACSLSTGGVITFPNQMIGMYCVRLQWTGGSTTLTNAIGFSTGSNINFPNYDAKDSRSSSGVTAGAVGTTQCVWVYINFISGLTTTGNTLTVNGGTLPTSLLTCDVWIAEMNSQIVT
nr:putative capsid protein [Crucivirus sp.]